jgi:hypothetical protein
MELDFDSVEFDGMLNDFFWSDNTSNECDSIASEELKIYNKSIVIAKNPKANPETKRIRCYNYVAKLPKVLKRDVRRMYGDMFVNVGIQLICR